MAETVLMTGGTGFVGGWCIVELLKRGYEVRTTVRSLSKEGAVRAAVEKGGASTAKLGFAVADLKKEHGWDAAVAGCDYVLHVASPLGGEFDGADLIGPARDGTLRVLRAAVNAGVKRVVLTSSCGAATPAEMGVNTVSDEATWSDASKQDPYRQSKTLAERAAWDFVKGRGGKTELATILPSAVFGPILTPEGLGSVQVIGRLLNGGMPRIPRIGLNIVDVRDLAVAHVLAMTIPPAAGQRFIANGDFMWMLEVAQTLKARLGARADKVSTKAAPDFIVKIGANFAPALKQVAPLLGRSHRFSSDKARRVLGFKSRPAAETVVDCAASLPVK